MKEVSEIKAQVLQKYIVTDEYKPMFAMAAIHGPQHGPLKTPVRVPIEVLGKILRQPNHPTLFEVVQESTTANGQRIFSERVELTLENYEMSYFDIVGKEKPVDITVIDPNAGASNGGGANENGTGTEDSDENHGDASKTGEPITTIPEGEGTQVVEAVDTQKIEETTTIPEGEGTQVVEAVDTQKTEEVETITEGGEATQVVEADKTEETTVIITETVEDPVVITEGSSVEVVVDSIPASDDVVKVDVVEVTVTEPTNASSEPKPTGQKKKHK